MRHTFVFSTADAQQINRKLMELMEQKADSDLCVQSNAQLDKNGVAVAGPAARQVREASLAFSAKEINEAMTKARQLLAA